MKNKEQFDDSLTHASDSEQNNSDHGSNQHDSVAESTRTNRDSIEPAPDRDALSRVWDQIQRRNNL